MAFRKYQKVEKQEVLSPDQHQRISQQLSKLGKSSVGELNERERELLEIDDATGVAIFED